MERAATSLAGGAPSAEAFPLPAPARAASERDLLETWLRRTLRALRDLHIPKNNATPGGTGPAGADSAVLRLLANTLMELATVAGTAARFEGRYQHGPAPSSLRHPAGFVAA